VNDFTKEELESLLVCIDGGIRHNMNADNLSKKIQFMIDNYCDHEWDEYTNHVECKKCHKICIID
jgi:hypothetical protein